MGSLGTFYRKSFVLDFATRCRYNRAARTNSLNKKGNPIMTTHFIDRLDHVSRQTFSAAVILDADGNQCGRIIVRFTDSQIGYNHEVGISFYHSQLPSSESNFSMSRKGSCYSNPATMVDMLQELGFTCWTHNKPVTGRGDYLSRFKDIESMKAGNRKFRILWAI